MKTDAELILDGVVAMLFAERTGEDFYALSPTEQRREIEKYQEEN